MVEAEHLLLAKTLVVAGWFAVFFLLERLAPADAWKPATDGFSQSRHLRNNLSLWLVNSLLSRVLVLPVTLVAVGLGRKLWSGLVPTPGFPVLLTLAAGILVLDLWIYWWHRFNHELPVLWRFHQVHHLDEQLDSTTALRFHLGEVALSTLARAPVIVLLALPLSTVLTFETLVLLAAIFHHSNVRLSQPLERLLSVFLITPGIHWVHHHATREDTDSNYGTLLSCWDRLFGSVAPGARQPGMRLGLSGRREAGVGTLLTLPFRKA